MLEGMFNSKPVDVHYKKKKYWQCSWCMDLIERKEEALACQVRFRNSSESSIVLLNLFIAQIAWSLWKINSLEWRLLMKNDNSSCLQR